jgi:hypothetical protein
MQNKKISIHVSVLVAVVGFISVVSGFVGVILGQGFYSEVGVEEVLVESGANESKEPKLEDILGLQMPIVKPWENPIAKSGYYSLDCETKYYTDITIGGPLLIADSYIKIGEGHEDVVLYVEGDIAKYFGADYSVLQDDDSYLVMVRTYPVSGLTETVSINKETGIGIDTKTLTFGASGQPMSSTYVLSCLEV